VILHAYEIAEGDPYRKKITLASGLTMPEATSAGMLPYQIGTALRKSDPVTFDQVRDALRAEGASTLFGRTFFSFALPRRTKQNRVVKD